MQPDSCNISRYWPRPGTPGAKLTPLSIDALKERTKRLNALFLDIATKRNKAWKGWQGKILITEQGKNGTRVGRNYVYKPVVLKGDFRIGQELQVEIVDGTAWDLRGSLP